MKRSEKEKRYEPLQYTASGLQSVLSAGKTKIAEWTKCGKLHSYFLDGGRFYHKDDVADFVERHRQGKNFEVGEKNHG